MKCKPDKSNKKERDFNVSKLTGTLTIEEGAIFGPIRMNDGSFGVLFAQTQFNPEGYFWECSDETDANNRFEEIKEKLSISAGILIQETGMQNWYAITDMSDLSPVL